jgi:hypothetical protein
MALLDNSSDIILDAVITPAGRWRMAQGRFKIVKFALGDDEINYNSWNAAAGSVYQDLNILRSPVFEASTNVGIRHHLVTRERNDILYLPVLKLNELEGTYAEGKARAGTSDPNSGFYVVVCDQATIDQFQEESALTTYTSLSDYVINGLSAEKAADGKLITIEQGLDTLEIPFNITLDADYEETAFDVYVDDRFGQIVSPDRDVAHLATVDENEIAHYILTDDGGGYFSKGRAPTDVNDLGNSVIQGPRGRILKFSVKASDALQRGTFFFEKFGYVNSTWFTDTPGTVNTTYTSAHLVDGTVSVVGRKNRFRIDIPVRWVRAKAT